MRCTRVYQKHHFINDDLINYQLTPVFHICKNLDVESAIDIIFNAETIKVSSCITNIIPIDNTMQIPSGCLGFYIIIIII